MGAAQFRLDPSLGQKAGIQDPGVEAPEVVHHQGLAQGTERIHGLRVWLKKKQS